MLARFLAHAHDGDIRRRDKVKFEDIDRKEKGGTTFKMLAAFENWFARSGELGARQLAVLRMLSLFGRPADTRCISALRDAPVIQGLTEPLFISVAIGQKSLEPLVEEDWNTLIFFLSDCGLLAINDSPEDQNRLLDCHPLVREYFAKRLRAQSLEAWEKGHNRLCADLSSK